MPLHRRLLVLAVLFGLVATACGGGASTANSDAPSALGSAAISPLAGEFATFGGPSIDLASLQGQDVVLWFWAPW